MKSATSAGYSGRALVDKLGIKAGFRVKTTCVLENYLELLTPLPENVLVSNRLRTGIDVWHMFVTSRRELMRLLTDARKRIKPNGMVWVSWPKKSSGVLSQVSEDTIREVALPMGLVDVKVCAVDVVWSGLKLVIRKELRS